jgi:serine/threonine-protein kinase RsbT
MSDEARVYPIRSDLDIVAARLAGRTLAQEVGFSGSDLIVVATAISELARNIVLYARHGEIHLGAIEKGGLNGIEVIARDGGPGIEDVEQAMQDGFSTSHGLGLGLPGTRRLMDEFDLQTKKGLGTTVTCRKWVR